jgi:hypothetical protein
VTIFEKLKAGQLLVGFCLFFFLQSCKTNDNVVSCHKYYSNFSSSVAIPKSKGMFWRPLNLKYYNDSVLAFTDNTWQRIHFYNLNNDSAYSINIKFKNHYLYISQFEFLKDDNILISFSTSHLEDKHDSCLMIYNIKNEAVVQVYNFEGSNLIIESNRNTKRYSQSDYIQTLSFPLRVSIDGKVLVSLSPSYIPCDSNYTNRKFSDLIYVSPIESNKPVEQVPIKLPCPNSVDSFNCFYTDNTKRIRGCVDLNNNYYVSYGIDNSIWKLNSNSTELIKTDCNPWFLEKTPCSNHEIDDVVNKNTIEYEELIFDKYRNQILRVVRLPISKDDPAILYNYPPLGIIIMDSSLNVLGFSKLPFGFERPIIASKNGVIGYNQYASRNTDSFIMEEYSLIKSKEAMNNVIVKSKDKSNGSQTEWPKYFLKLDSSLLRYNDLIIIPISNSCESCLVTMADYLNDAFINDSTIAKVFVADSKKALDGYLKSHNIKSKSSFYYDSNKTYESFLKELYNIHVISKKNDEYLDRKYGPDELPFLPMNLGFSYEIKKMELKCINCK